MQERERRGAPERRAHLLPLQVVVRRDERLEALQHLAGLDELLSVRLLVRLQGGVEWTLGVRLRGPRPAVTRLHILVVALEPPCLKLQTFCLLPGKAIIRVT